VNGRDEIDEIRARRVEDAPVLGNGRVATVDRRGFTTLSGIGFVTTASYAYLVGEDSSYTPLSLVMQIMVSGW
jgi:hypothetical protein